MSHVKGSNLRLSGCLLLGLLVIGTTACRESRKADLDELALPAPAPSRTLEEDAVSPLLELRIQEPALLLERLEPVVTLFAASDWLEAHDALLEEFRNWNSLYFSVLRLNVGLDEKTGDVTLSSLALVLHGVPGKEVGGSLALEQATAVTESLKGLIPADLTSTCSLEGTGIVCRLSTSSWPEGLAHGIPENPGDGASLLRLTANPSAFLGMMEETFGAGALWAMVPEEFSHWKELGIELPGEMDRITVRIRTRLSDALPVLEQITSIRRDPVVVPIDTPVVVLTTLNDLENLIEDLDKAIGRKLGPGAALQLRKVVSSSWKTEMSEVVRGYCGFFAGEKISLTSPMGDFVYFLQPRDEQYLHKRLRYVFAKKHYRVEEREMRSGEPLKVAVRRGRRKRKEHLAWMEKAGVWYLSSTAHLQHFAEGVFIPEWKKNPKKKTVELSLEPDELLHATISLNTLVERLDLADLGGMGAGMALAVVKTIAEDAPAPIEISLRLRSVIPARHELELHIDNVLALTGAASKHLAPFLRLMNERRRESGSTGNSRRHMSLTVPERFSNSNTN